MEKFDIYDDIARLSGGEPKMLEHNDIRFITPSEIPQYEFCPADTDILAEIKRCYEKRKPL